MTHDIAPPPAMAPIARFLAISSAWLKGGAAQQPPMERDQTRSPWGDGARLPVGQWVGPMASSQGPTTPISTAK